MIYGCYFPFRASRFSRIVLLLMFIVPVYLVNLSLFFICLFLSCLNVVQIGEIYKFKGV